MIQNYFVYFIFLIKESENKRSNFVSFNINIKHRQSQNNGEDNQNF